MIARDKRGLLNLCFIAKEKIVSNFDYDLLVIGAGSGGVRAARMAAGFGARVAIVEDFQQQSLITLFGDHLLQIVKLYHLWFLRLHKIH